MRPAHKTDAIALFTSGLVALGCGSDGDANADHARSDGGMVDAGDGIGASSNGGMDASGAGGSGVVPAEAGPAEAGMPTEGGVPDPCAAPRPCLFAERNENGVCVSTDWDQMAELPPEMPESGEPEDFVLAREHDQKLADGIGDLWELVAQPFADVERHSSPLGRFHYRFVVHADDAPAPDFFRAKNMRYKFISERVSAAVGSDAFRWCRRHPVEFR